MHYSNEKDVFFFLCSFPQGICIKYDLTLPIVGSTFQMTGRHDLIGSSRSVEIFAAALGSSTSGSKAYFLFKLHDSTSGESGRQQQLTTRLSSCILDMWVVQYTRMESGRLFGVDDPSSGCQVVVFAEVK